MQHNTVLPKTVHSMVFGVTYKMYRNSQFVSLILYRYLKSNILLQILQKLPTFTFDCFLFNEDVDVQTLLQYNRRSYAMLRSELYVIAYILHHRVLFIDLICFLLLLVLFAKCAENTFHGPIVIHILFIIIRFYN